MPDGSVSASAVVYDSSTGGGIALANSAVIKARGLTGDAWTALATAGFVVTAQTGPAANLRITEINYNPATPTESELAVNPALDNEDFEFIEITNVGDQAVDLTGIKFDAGITFDFTSADVKTLAPGASVLLVSNAQAFETRYGTGLNVAGQYTGQLSNGGEQLRLLSAVDAVIQEFSYDDQDGWPTAADGGGYTLELVQLGSDPSDPTAWKIGALGGSPGEWAELVDGVLAGGV